MYDEVIEDGTLLVNLEPDNSESYNLRLQAYIETGRLDEALQDCIKALQLDKQNTFALAIKEIFTTKKEIILEGNPNVSAGTSYATLKTHEGKDQSVYNKKESDNNISSLSREITRAPSSSNPCLPLYQEYIEYGHTVTEWYGQNHSGITSEVKRDALKTQLKRMHYEKNKMYENYKSCEDRRNAKPVNPRRGFEGVKKLERPNYQF